MAVIPEQIATHDSEPRLLISELCRQLDSYLEADQIREVYRAYLFSAEAHEGQQRVSGEPYIYHPLSVAQILADMRMDYKSIIAAILHDVIEDTGTAKEQVAKSFGEEVAELVDGVSKLTQITFESQAQAQAENFRKMMLAMVRDIRVILIKLADRLHNMRTLGVMPPAKRRRIARETLDIYAPIANRLGMNNMRLELEDLGFAAYYPIRARTLAEAVRRARGNRKEILTKIEASLKQRLEHDGVSGRVHSREKHLLSLYLKMRSKRLSFNDVFDVYAFRVVVEDVDTCYRVLGVVHSLYKPVPGRFKDYIAIPKANGYQSLHTVLFGPYGVPIEVQIRTDDMDRVAEAGIAAHWLYKSASGGAHERAREWLRELLEMQQHAGNSLEFLENVKIDLFPDEVYVFTPRGKIMELPRAATAVDFAYAVHTDVGNTCIAAKIDRRLAPLRTPLHNGQTVEIITAPGARPNPSWLNFAVTGKARSSIRHYLKNLHRDEAINLGRRLLDKSLLSLGMQPTELSSARLQEIATSYGMQTADDLLEDIGLGNRMPMLAARRLLGNDETGEVAGDAAAQPSSAPLIIKGTEGMVVNFAKCCRPIPGDRIVGFVSAGRGVVIHAENCKNIADFRNRPDKWVDVEWEREVKGEFSAELRVEVANQRGVLATVAAAIADMGSNIENVAIEERDGLNTSIAFTITVHDRKHLARVMRRVRHIPLVLRISRAKS